MSDEEIPIELYKKANGEFVKFVRYDDYKKLENIIKEASKYIKEHIREDDEYPGYMDMLVEDYKELLEILDKEGE